ncbi:MAG: SGNH/GDSL hydrolase family protein [Candidatus Omnitrophota bacterium]
MAMIALKDIAFIFGVSICAFVLAETVLRVLYRMNLSSPLPYGLRKNMLGRLGYIKLAPNFKGKSRFGISYRTNSLGYRDDEIDPGKKHVLFLGDSTTFGMNIDHEETYPEVFEKLLNRIDGDLQSVNTATPGQGTLDQLDILKPLLGNGDLNIKAVVLGFFDNDFSDNYSHSISRSKERKGGILFEAKRYITESIGVPRAYIYLTLWYGRILKDLKKNMNLVSGKRDRARSVSGVSGIYNMKEEGDIRRNVAWKLTIEALDDIMELCDRHDIPFIFTYLPPRAEEALTGIGPKYESLLREYLKGKRNVYYINAAVVYRNYLEKNGASGHLPEGFYSHKSDFRHPGPLACELIAQELSAVYQDIARLRGRLPVSCSRRGAS